MQIQQNISLKTYNSFAVDVAAKHFAKFTSVSELDELLQPSFSATEIPPLVIGGGSNLLFTQDYNGLVIRNEMLGISVVREDAHHIYVRAAAGENWHQFVLYCIRNNFAGVENLSLIPGSVGASPIQNIGAYGVEIKDVFYELEAYSRDDNTLTTFSNNDCQFGYRESVFKRKYKGRFVITSVTFKLNKTPVFQTNYGALQQELEKMGVQNLSIAAISQAIVHIRQSKLPDPGTLGNAGSFFKNPTISATKFHDLQKEFTGIPGFPANDQVKVAAGWLIEQCGWKGYRKGDAGCYEKQALVLVNYGKAKGEDIFNLSTEIMHSVEAKFGIVLEREVNVI
ncbi:MAG TPA: UDP-N-acetylmuramate dehydrogenase [Segetibacter sp.]